MDAIFMGILDMSLVSVYCIAIVLLIRLLLRKAPKFFSYILWIVVFVRLVLPFTPESPISLVPQVISENSVTAWMSKEATPALVQSMIPASDVIEPMQEANGGITVQIPVDPAIKTLTAPLRLSQEKGIAQSQILASADSVASVSDGPMNLSLPQIFSIIWLVGIFVLLSFNVIAYILLRKRLKSALHQENNIFVSSSIESPFILGIIRPRIYIPSNLQESDRAHILRHEQIHIQRGDHIIKAILYVITCVHWFNPLVWLAFAFMSRDMEMSCDEKVIRELGYGIKKNYSSSLLNLATGRNLLHATPLAFGEGSLKGRIKNIVNYRKPALWIILTSTIIVGFVVVGLIFNPLQRKDPDENDPTRETTEATTQSANETSPTTSATTDPSETKPISDDPYENLFIEVDGEQISYKRVIDMPSKNYTYIYDLSPLDYKTTSPVDVSDFQTVFTDAGYVVEEGAGIHNESSISGWDAKSSDGKDAVRCYNYDSEEDANQAVCQWAMEYLYHDAKSNEDYYSHPLKVLFTDSALFLYDDDVYNDGSDTFYIAYQTGSSVVLAEIAIDIPHLMTFYEAMDTLGITFPSICKLNTNPGEWPEKAVFASVTDFTNILTDRGYNVELFDPDFQWEWYAAQLDELHVYVSYGLEWDNSTPAKQYLGTMSMAESDYPGANDNMTIEYHSSDSYEMIIYSSDNEYGITVYFDLTGVDTPYDGPYDRTTWYIQASTGLMGRSEEEVAAVRAEIDAVIRELCFPE